MIQTLSICVKDFLKFIFCLAEEGRVELPRPFGSLGFKSSAVANSRLVLPCCLDERARTFDLTLPKRALYQTELHQVVRFSCYPRPATSKVGKYPPNGYRELLETHLWVEPLDPKKNRTGRAPRMGVFTTLSLRISHARNEYV